MVWAAGVFATLGSNLGISTLLEILQACKLDHNVAVKCTWARPPSPHPPQPPPPHLHNPSPHFIQCTLHTHIIKTNVKHFETFSCLCQIITIRNYQNLIIGIIENYFHFPQENTKLFFFWWIYLFCSNLILWSWNLCIKSENISEIIILKKIITL